MDNLTDDLSNNAENKDNLAVNKLLKNYEHHEHHPTDPDCKDNDENNANCGSESSEKHLGDSNHEEERNNNKYLAKSKEHTMKE